MVNNSGVPSTDPAAASVRPPEPGRSLATEISDCWNKIGVYGNASCSELRQFVHCRNCPVYSTAGLRLLDRPLPEQYRSAWTRHFAQEKRIAASGNTSAVLFRISAEWFALPTRALQEVAEQRRIHSLPHRRHGVVLGLANVRGELLVCVSLGHLLSLEGIPPREALRATHHRLLVANWEGTRVAFPVDEVQGTHRFQLQELTPPPATVAKANPAFTQGIFRWKERAIGFLNVDLLLPALNRSLS
jgi:chemotaxis-related protein WspD